MTDERMLSTKKEQIKNSEKSCSNYVAQHALLQFVKKSVLDIAR